MKRIPVIMLIILAFLLCGCTLSGGRESEDYVYIDINEGALLFGTIPVPPQTNPDGSPFTLAYIDIDPYPATGVILYYVIMGLRDEGWISFDSLPFDPGDTDAGALIDWLAEQELGPYIRFDKTANYYTAFQEELEIFESLSGHVQNGSIDLILTMGTSPARMAKSFGLNIPIMMFGAVDPISSGLIKSIEDPGEPNIWAVFDPTAYERQLLYYYDRIPFYNLGIVYYNEAISALEMYRRAADSLGVRVTESQISRIDQSTQESENAYYENLSAEFKRLVENEGIDAFMLTTDIILDSGKVEQLLEVFTENKIPVFVQIGQHLVEHGALMNVSPMEVEGQGIFGARSITQALTGTPLNELPQEYRNSPFLTLNLDVADRIGFKPTFETLLASERIFVLRPD